MSPNDAAKSLLKKLALPYGTVSILPWREGDKVVMHVLVDRLYLHQAHVPQKFEGYACKLEERHAALAR